MGLPEQFGEYTLVRQLAVGGMGEVFLAEDSSLDRKVALKFLPELLQSDPTARERLLQEAKNAAALDHPYICKIIDKKVSRGETFLITDGGLHHHLAASGNFGQVIRKNYPVAIANRMNKKEKEIVNIVGPLCTPLDILANKMELPKTDIGDLVVVYQSGAYGLTASPVNFLSHPIPGEILV